MTIGRILAIGLALVALFMGQIFLGIVAFFIFIVGGQEEKAVATREVLRGARVSQAITSNAVALSPNATIGQVATLMMTSRQPDFAVLDPDTGQLLGVATDHNVIEAIQQGRWRSNIVDIMQQARHVPVIALNATLDEIQEKLTQTSSRVAAVYDGLYFRGLISLDDIHRTLQFLSQSGIVKQRMSWEIGR